MIKLPDKELLQMAERLVSIRSDKDKLEEQLKLLSEQEKSLQLKFVEGMELSHIQSFDHKELGKFYLESRVLPRMKDIDKFRAWLKVHEISEEGIVKSTCNAQTLGAWYREQLKEGSMVPESEIVEVYTDTRVKYKAK